MVVLLVVVVMMVLVLIVLLLLVLVMGVILVVCVDGVYGDGSSSVSSSVRVWDRCSRVIPLLSLTFGSFVGVFRL